MFESITLGPLNSTDGKIDVGHLAECLLFYEKVRIVTSAESFRTLVQTCGADELLELRSMGNLEIEFLENLTMISSIQTNVGICHDMGMVTSNVIRLPQVARKIADSEAGGSGKRANKLFDRLNSLVNRTEYTKAIITGAQSDLSNQAYLEESIKGLLSYLVPDYKQPELLIFKPTFVPKFGYRYDTNIRFDEVSHIFRANSPSSDIVITPAYLLAQITGAEPDLIIASTNGSEFALNPFKSRIVSSKFESIIRSYTGGKDRIDAFQEIAIEGSRPVREVVNSGQRTFRDVIRLVGQAQKFKNWTQQIEDGNLRDEYCKAVARVDWADKLPPKQIRFLIMTGLSVVAGLTLSPVAGAAVGVGLNATDYFMLDRLLKGWKPNQFVQGPLQSFLAPDDSVPPKIVP